MLCVEVELGKYVVTVPELVSLLVVLCVEVELGKYVDMVPEVTVVTLLVVRFGNDVVDVLGSGPVTDCVGVR